MPQTVPVVSRRRVLAGGTALALLGVAVSACGSAPEPAVDELESQLTLARRDSALAGAASAAAAPPIGPALTEVASERAKHAQALAAEIARVAGNPTSTSSGGASPTAANPAAPAPSLSDVVNALRTSAQSAAQLATTSSGYRAGLLGSIAAACTAAYTVGLAFGESTP